MMREPIQIKTPPTPAQERMLAELNRQYFILDTSEQLVDITRSAIDKLINMISQAEANRT